MKAPDENELKAGFTQAVIEIAADLLAYFGADVSDGKVIPLIRQIETGITGKNYVFFTHVLLKHMKAFLDSTSANALFDLCCDELYGFVHSLNLKFSDDGR